MATYDDLMVDIGNAPDDDQGDPLRTAFDKINQRFAELRVFLRNRGDWAPSTVYTANPNRDWVIFEGEGYLATSNHTSGATFAADLAAGEWVNADAIQLRADLGQPDGAKHVGGVDLPLADYDALRAYAGTKTRVYITGALGVAKPAGIAGVFQHDATDTTSADDGGTVIVGIDGRRWKRDFSGAVSIKWFGAAGDANASGSAGTNDAAAFALLEAAHAGEIVNLEGETYLVNSPVPHANQYINGRLVVDAATTDDQPGNFAIGVGALLSNTFIPRQFSSSTLTWAAGNFNTAVGDNAMRLNTTGRRNTAVGSQAMYNCTTGYYNTALGSFAQFNLGTGNYNVAVGNQSQQYLTSGNSNVAIGNGTMVNAANGSDNTAVGDTALTATTNRNVAIGKQAGWQNTGNDCVAIGYQALSNPVASGLYNVVIGNAAGGGISTGSSNTALGSRALSASNTGSSNTAIGNDAMVSAGNGSSNTAVGSLALPNNTTGYQNVAVGVNALNVNSTGSNNVAVGRYAAQANTEGFGNVSIGEQSLASNTTGNYNTAIGTGANSGGPANSNTTAIGYQATVTGSNQVQLGNSSTTTYAYGAVQNRSDARDKADVRDTMLGLEFINALRPVDFKWDMRDDYFEEVDEEVEVPVYETTEVGIGILDEAGREFTRAETTVIYKTEHRRVRRELPKDGSKKRGRFHHGLIAQELKQVIDHLGIDFGGLQDHSLNGGKDVMSIGYEELIAPLVKAVQQLSAEVEALSGKNR